MTSAAITRKLNVFCAWYKITRGVRVLQFILFGALLAMAGLIVVDKLLWINLDQNLALSVIASVSLIVLLGFILLSRRHETEVGYLVDRAAGLKNLIGSSLDTDGDDSEVAQRVRERAYASLTSQQPRALIPLSLNWAGRYLYIPAALLVAAVMLPEIDLLKRSLVADTQEEEEVITNKTAIKLQAAMKSVEETQTTPSQSIDGKNIEKDFKLLPDKLVNASKNKALSEIGEFENKYARDFEKQRSFEKLAKALKEPTDMTGIPLDAQKDLKRLAQGMQEGNFKDAAEAMRDLAKRLADKKTPPNEKQALARELEKLMEQMQGPKEKQGDGQNGNQNANPAD